MSLYSPPKGRHGCKACMKFGGWVLACPEALAADLHLCVDHFAILYPNGAAR